MKHQLSADYPSDSYDAHVRGLMQRTAIWWKPVETHLFLVITHVNIMCTTIVQYDSYFRWGTFPNEWQKNYFRLFIKSKSI